MKRFFFAFVLVLACALLPLLAQAQTVINIVAQTCNVANTACVLQGDGGQVIAIDPSPPAAMVIDDIAYTQTGIATILLVSTNYRHVTEVTFTFAPSAKVDALYILARGGSGRGGWAWHPHWQFLTITVY